MRVYCMRLDFGRQQLITHQLSDTDSSPAQLLYQPWHFRRHQTSFLLSIFCPYSQITTTAADVDSHSSAFNSPLITVYVGSDDEARKFEIRKDILTFYSGYFAAALNGRFTEAEENVCRLPEEDPMIFEMFQHWIHTRTLYESTLDPSILMSYEVSVKRSCTPLSWRMNG